MASSSSFSRVFVIVQVYLLISESSGGVTDPPMSICPGTCIGKETSCNITADHTNCGSESVCCLDDFEMTTEPGFDFSTLSSENSEQWTSAREELERVSHPATELYETDEDTFFTTMESEGNEDFVTTEPQHGEFFTMSPDIESTNLEHCPGACIPQKHARLCQYIIPLDSMCFQGKACCATREAAQQFQELQVDEEMAEFKSLMNECPGRCIHPSLTIFCDEVLTGYDCPMDSKCCGKPIASATPETASIECTGECISSQSAYLCLPPYELVPGTSNCRQSTVCCMRSSNENDYSVPEANDGIQTSNTYFEDVDKIPQFNDIASVGLASDEHGQLYYVYQSGQFRPLPSITPEESLSPIFSHFADVDVETGKASMYKDATGNLYQLSEADFQSDAYMESQQIQSNFHLEPQQDFQSYPQMAYEEARMSNRREQSYDFYHNRDPQNHFSQYQEQKAIISAPDDSDDIEENLKDVILLDEGDEVVGDSAIPPGERTMIKPQCPGSCVSTFLKFTCIRKSAIHDGFSCPTSSVCCARLTDIEEHEKYLASLSPYFKATPIENEENRQTCFTGGINDFTSTKEKLISNYCWQVALINSQNQYICGGVAIHNSWVLTAAHCVTGALRQDQALYVRAGVTDLTNGADSAAGQTRRALSIFVHHKHNSMSLDNDIALLRLQSPLEMNVNVCIACLPSKDSMPPMDSTCRVSGYGFVSKVGTMSLKIHDAGVPLIDDMDCIANVTDVLSTVFILPGSSFCAGGRGFSETCQGDAGGPLMCYNNGRNELTGLVSWSLGCGKDDVPSIYVKIPSFMNWINQIISASAFLKALT